MIVVYVDDFLGLFSVGFFSLRFTIHMPSSPHSYRAYMMMSINFIVWTLLATFSGTVFSQTTTLAGDVVVTVCAPSGCQCTQDGKNLMQQLR